MGCGASSNRKVEPEGLEVAQSTTSGHQELQEAIEKLEEEELPEATKNQEDIFRKSLENMEKLEDGAAGAACSSTSKQELPEAIKKLEEEVRVDLEDPVALATFLVTANIKLIRAEYLFHLATEDRRLPRRQEAEGESFVDRAGKTRSALVDHTEVQAWAAGSREAIIVSVSHAWEAREHPDPCGYQLEQVVNHTSLFVAAFAAEIWLFFDYVSLFQFKREPGTEEQSFRRSMGNMHAMYAHESTMTFRVESLTPEQRWQKAVQDGLQVKIFHEKSGLIRPVPLEDSENLTKNRNLYFDRGWCRAEMSWSSVRGDTAQNQRVDLEVAVTKEKEVIDAHLTGRTPLAPDTFAAEMHSAAFTHRKDEGAVIDLQKKVFLEKVTRRRKLKVEGISLQQIQALTQSLRHFEQLNSITLNDFRCGNDEAKAFVEALATTPIKKIRCKTRNQNSLDCLVKAMAVASKTLKISHLDLATSEDFYWAHLGAEWAQLGASGAEAIAVFLESTTTLVNLDLSCQGLWNRGAEVLAEALKKNRTLKRLNLASNAILVEGVQAIAVFLKSTTTLINLDLSRNHLLYRGAEVLAEALKKNRTLKRLNLASNHIGVEEDQAFGITKRLNRGVEVLAEALKKNRTLKRLNLADNAILVEGVQALQQALETNTTLEHLELFEEVGLCAPPGAAEAITAACRANPCIRKPSTALSEASDGSEEQALKSPFEAAVRIKGLADKLRLNPIITAELNLNSQNICDEQLKALADAFRVNKTIKEVSLTRNQIGNEGVKALASAMEINETITEVMVDHHYDYEEFAMLSNEGRQALKDIQRFCNRNKVREVCELCRSQSITIVDLRSRKLGDEEVKALADAFLVNKTVERVDLDHNQIGDEGVKALADAFRVNKTIKGVYLDRNQIGNEGVKALASAMEINETITVVFLYMEFLDEDEEQLAMLGDEGRQALKDLKDIQRFCNRNKALQEKKLEAAIRNRQCLSGHDLRLEEMPYDGRCNRCDGSLSQGERVYRCGECNFDLCLKCLKTPEEDAPVGSIVPTNAEP